MNFKLFKNKINKYIILIVFLILVNLILFLNFNNEVYNAEEQKFYTVEFSHDKTGIGKEMVDRNFSKEMQLEKIDDNSYILYTSIDRTKMNNYSLQFFADNKKINTALLDRKNEIEIYGSYIKDCDIYKDILINIYIPQMGRNMDIKIKLNNLKSGSYNIYNDAVKNINKPTSYFYEFFDSNGEKIKNKSQNVGSFNKDKFKIKNVKKIGYNEEKDIEQKDIKYKFIITFKNNNKKEITLDNLNYENEIAKINFNNINKIIVIYYINDGNSINENHYANTNIIQKYVYDKTLNLNETKDNEEDIDIPNLNQKSKNSINIMALTIGLLNGVLFLIVAAVLISVIIKNKKQKNKNS